MADEPVAERTMAHLPRGTLEFVLRKLIEDRYLRTRELAKLRERNEQLRILLRSALWDYAQHNGAKVPSRFVREWLGERWNREL